MKLIKTIIVALFFIIAITFALQNQQVISINYYGLIPSFSVPLFLIVFFSILLGILIAGFGDIFVRYSLRIRARKCEKALKACQNELDTLKRAREETEQDQAVVERKEPKESGRQEAVKPSQPVVPTENA